VISYTIVTRGAIYSDLSEQSLKNLQASLYDSAESYTIELYVNGILSHVKEM